MIHLLFCFSINFDCHLCITYFMVCSSAVPQIAHFSWLDRCIVIATTMLHCGVMLLRVCAWNFSDIYKVSGLVTSFQQIIDNLFRPLFEVTNDPASHPELHCFLYYVSETVALFWNFCCKVKVLYIFIFYFFAFFVLIMC